jgi:hypothetical protein
MMFDTSVFETQPWLAPTIVLLAVWSYVWKALALYRAGYNRSPIWFFFMLIVNTVGILDIFYLFVFGRKKR